MSDKITEFTELNMQKEPERRTFTRKTAVFAVIVVAVCSVVSLFLFQDGLNFDSVRRWGKYLFTRGDEAFGAYSFDAHSSNCYDNFEEGLAVASIGGLSIYGTTGEEMLILQRQLELPRLLVNQDMAIAYDVGGSSLIGLHKNEGEVLNITETHPILDADLSPNGAVCLSSSASGYKSVLSVYSEEQELIYRWLSSSTYFPLCAVSANGKDFAAVAVGQSEGVFESSVYLFKTDAEEVLDEISLGSDLIYDILYLSEGSLCAIGETGIQFISEKGEVSNTYQYRDAYLKDFDCGGDGFLTLATNMYRAGNRYSLTTVNEKGKELATCYIGSELLDMSATGKYIAVLTPGKLTVYTQSLSVYYETTAVSGVTSVVMRRDGSVLLIGGGEGKLYIP